MPNLPYFDVLLAALERGDADTVTSFGRHVHWGWWENPAAADGSAGDFAAAADRMTALVCEAAGASDGMRMLDVGCGFGGTVAWLNENRRAVDVTGLNLDGRQLARARRELAPRPGNTLSFVEGDACRLPFPDRSFDAVTAVECIFHFPSRDDFFREARRVLRPGGRLAVSDFVPRWWTSLLLSAMEWVGLASAENPTYGRNELLTRAGYRKLSARAGLRPVQDRDVTAATLPTYPFVRRLMVRLDPGARAERATANIEWLSRHFGLRYRILVWKADSEAIRKVLAEKRRFFRA